MAYSDILNTTSLYGNLLNKNWANAGNRLDPNQFNDLSIDPNSSAAFVPRSARNIYNRPMDVTSDMDAFSDYDPWSLQGGTQQVIQGLQYGSIGETMTPYISDFGKGLSNTFRGKEWGASMTGPGGEVLTGRYGSYGEMGDLSSAAAVYGLTQDQNPYTHTQTEHLGTMATTALAARAIAPMVGLGAATTAQVAAGSVAPILGMNPYVLVAALLIGHFWGKKKKKKAKNLQKKAVGEFDEATTDIYETRSEAVQEQKEEMLSEQQSRMHEQRQGQYSNQYGGNYRNYMAEKGMKFSPKELKKIASAGRNGDTQLAHINPQEAQMLKSMGGSGTINPYTGLREYGLLSSILDAASSVVSGVGNVVTTVLDPVFDAAGNIVDPIMTGVGDFVEPIMEGATDAAGGIIEGTLGGVQSLGHDVLIPVFEGIGEPVLDVMGNVIDWVGGLFGSGDIPTNPYDEGAKPDIQRDPKEKDNILAQTRLSGLKQNKALGLERRNKPTMEQGDWVGDKPNPYIAPNVEEEIDYAKKGMKYKYAKGGKANIVAEFTGNELIVNDQDALEKALANKNYSKAATSIRNAMQKKQLTPGAETHGGNPMPVDDKGNIYAGGGALPFKVNKGAGIYDHATDQFSPTMTDKEISMIAQNNINKWKSNNMYA